MRNPLKTACYDLARKSLLRHSQSNGPASARAVRWMLRGAAGNPDRIAEIINLVPSVVLSVSRIDSKSACAVVDAVAPVLGYSSSQDLVCREFMVPASRRTTSFRPVIVFGQSSEGCQVRLGCIGDTLEAFNRAIERQVSSGNPTQGVALGIIATARATAQETSSVPRFADLYKPSSLS